MTPQEQEPLSARTPVVFDTEVAPPSTRSHRPSLGRRLAPIAIVPFLLAAFALLRSAPPFAPAETLGASLAPHTKASKPSAAVQAFDGLEEATLCPTGMSFVARDDVRVCVDRWEASIAEVLPNGAERPHSPYLTPRTWMTGFKVKAVSRPGATPQAYVSRVQAEIACKNAGKRLCSAKEWRTACEGPARTTYPYGNVSDPKACNTKGRNPLLSVFGSTKKIVWGSAMHSPLLNQLPGTVAKTGSYEKCTNDYGVYDMVGNLHEWTADGAFRGGYYRDDKINAPGCRYHTTAHVSTYSDYSTGFRCCADPH